MYVEAHFRIGMNEFPVPQLVQVAPSHRGMRRVQSRSSSGAPRRYVYFVVCYATKLPAIEFNLFFRDVITDKEKTVIKRMAQWEKRWRRTCDMNSH